MSDNVRPHIHALIERGKITLEEYKELRCNSWEYEALVPALSIEALIWASENCIRNCSRVSRPATTYDEAVYSVYAPELIRRLRLLQKTQTRFGDCAQRDLSVSVLRIEGSERRRLSSLRFVEASLSKTKGTVS